MTCFEIFFLSTAATFETSGIYVGRLCSSSSRTHFSDSSPLLFEFRNDISVQQSKNATTSQTRTAAVDILPSARKHKPPAPERQILPIFKMTAELQRLANDPNFVVEFAVGDPAPTFTPQSRDAGIRLSGVYFDRQKRYVLKSAHMSREDNRIFDPENGRCVLVSHHPGKNPYDAFDPLGTTNQGNRYKVAGGEWESVCDVTARARGFRSFKIRPKALSRHGRQYIKIGDQTIMNVGKVGKLKTMSIRDHFTIGKGEDGDDVYTCIADMTGRSVMIKNQEDQLVAQMAKTTKAIMMTAAFGSGSESTIDIAPGVDCSTILAAVFGMAQVGEHCKFYRRFATLRGEAKRNT